MYKSPEKPAQASASLKFFEWAYANGDKAADELDYVPMPASAKDVVRKQWGEIKDSAGKAISYK
jgi:phosphate transport system substrate-binding protein